MERPELTLQASLFPQEKLINISQIKNANLDEPLTMGIYLLILEKIFVHPRESNLYGFWRLLTVNVDFETIWKSF